MAKQRPHDAELILQLMRELKASAEESAERLHHQILLLEAERRECLEDAARRGREIAELEARPPRLKAVALTSGWEAA